MRAQLLAPVLVGMVTLGACSSQADSAAPALPPSEAEVAPEAPVGAVKPDRAYTPAGYDSAASPAPADSTTASP